LFCASARAFHIDRSDKIAHSLLCMNILYILNHVKFRERTHFESFGIHEDLLREWPVMLCHYLITSPHVATVPTLSSLLGVAISLWRLKLPVDTIRSVYHNL
jgi:hypothetical protein